MNRLAIALAIVLGGMVILVFTSDNQEIVGLQKEDFGRLVYLIPIALLLSAGIWRSRHSLGRNARHFLIWVVIILGVSAAYIYRNDASAFGNRLLAGLVPGHALIVTDTTGNQEVILHKMMNGHFQAEVAINGKPVPMLIDTGASMIALSRKDAERIGIVAEDLTYSMTVTTANGRARAAPVMLSEVAVGPITRRNVPASVAEDGALDESLLGMSFLGTLGSLQMQTDELRLRD